MPRPVVPMLNVYLGIVLTAFAAIPLVLGFVRLVMSLVVWVLVPISQPIQIPRMSVPALPLATDRGPVPRLGMVRPVQLTRNVQAEIVLMGSVVTPLVPGFARPVM